MRNSIDLFPTETGENYFKKKQSFKVSGNSPKSIVNEEILVQENLLKLSKKSESLWYLN